MGTTDVLIKRKEDEIDALINKKKEEILNLHKEQAYFDALTIYQRAAIILHNLTCTWNHTDGCSWSYEISKGIHQWEGSEHKIWLQRAKNLLSAGYSTEDVTKIKEILKS